MLVFSSVSCTKYQLGFSSIVQHQNVPCHPLGTRLRRWRHVTQLGPQPPNRLNRIAGVGRQGLCNVPPDKSRYPRPLAVGAHHDLQRSVSVYAPKVKVALWWHVGNVGGDLPLLAQLPDCRRSRRVVNGDEDHLGAIEIARFEEPVGVCDLVLGFAELDFLVEAGGGAYDVDVGVGI